MLCDQAYSGFGTIQAWASSLAIKHTWTCKKPAGFGAIQARALWGISSVGPAMGGSLFNLKLGFGTRRAFKISGCTWLVLAKVFFLGTFVSTALLEKSPTGLNKLELAQ